MNDELKKILDIIIKEKGGSYKDYRLLMDKIGYHESKSDNKAVQAEGGPGRGKYQYEIGENRGANTAVNRLYGYYRDNKLPIPKWVKNIPPGKSVDTSKLQGYQQDILFLADKMKHPKADFSKVINGEQSTTDFWLKNHWSGKDKDVTKRTESFNRDLESFKTQKQPINNIPRQEDLYSYLAKPNVGKFPSEDPNEYSRGGQMGDTNLNNGEFNQFNEGGSHEANPNGGIPMGTGQNGKKNTVEQGESSFDFEDGKYIFSARLGLNTKIK
jgi:hypothetical protein